MVENTVTRVRALYQNEEDKNYDRAGLTTVNKSFCGSSSLQLQIPSTSNCKGGSGSNFSTFLIYPQKGLYAHLQQPEVKLNILFTG